MADPQQQQMTFDSAPVKQDTPVPQAPPSGGMVFDSSPVAQDTSVADIQSKSPATSPANGQPRPPRPEEIANVSMGGGRTVYTLHDGRKVDSDGIPIGQGSTPAATPAQKDFLSGMGEETWGTAKGLVTHTGLIGAAQDAYDATVNQLPAVYRAYEKTRKAGGSLKDALSAASEEAKRQEDSRNFLKQRYSEFQKNPNRAAGKNLADALSAVLMGMGAESLAPEAGATPEVSGSPEAAVADAVGAAEPKPGIVQQLIKGKKVAQPGAEAAVRQGVQSSTEAAGTADESVAANIENQPILKGNQTVLDEPLNALKEKESALYKKVDDAAGFDLKAEKAQLANDKYKLTQLGNTDADITQRGNLTEAINDATDRIAQAEAKLKEAGIDPKAADAAHQQRMAGQDFKKAVVKNTNADGSVNIDGLLKDSKNLRFHKYGDRLGQFMGNDGADAFVSKLEQMQKLGAHAMKTQQIAKWIAGALGVGSVAGIAHVAAVPVP
jgi:hypothetical protein